MAQISLSLRMKITKLNPFVSQAALIDQERCLADLMYRILVRPQDAIVKQVLDSCFQLIEKKNSPDLNKSRMYREANEYVMSEMADAKVRLFYLLFIVAKESEVQDLFAQGIQVKHPGNLFGNEAIPHLYEYFKILHDMCDKTLNFNYNPVNILVIVDKYLEEAKRMYVLN